MEKNNEYQFIGKGLTAKETHWGKIRFDEYKKNYSVIDFSDLLLLESLVFREALIDRYKKKIEKANKDAKKASKNGEENSGRDVVPKAILNSIDDLLKQCLDLKNKLGLLHKGLDEARVNKQREKKFKYWMSQNQACRTVKCEHCGKMCLLTIRTDKYNAQKHPDFFDKYLVNLEAWRCYLLGKISKLELTRILLGQEASLTDYISWVEKKLESNQIWKDFLKKVEKEKK